MAERSIQIAIDGPAASGKSTVARLSAERLNGYYINTGDMYRAVTWKILSHGIDPEQSPDTVAALLPSLNLRYRRTGPGQVQLYFDDVPVPRDKIRAPGVAANVSQVARLTVVREWLINRQRETAELGLIVMEGRDIGTVIFPDAAFKFYITASPEVRARRRLRQKEENPPDATVATVAAEIARRDRIDSTRAVAPLRPADDAIIIETDDLTAEEVTERVVRTVEEEKEA